MQQPEFCLKFTTDNAAFEGDDGPPEVARILREIAHNVEGSGHDCGTVRDANGNRIGSWSLEFTEAEEDAEDAETDEDEEA